MRTEHPAGRAAVASPPPAAGPQHAREGSSTARVPGRRHGGPEQDHALYNCQCGFVFEAPVSTSVGCPHCGLKQAW